MVCRRAVITPSAGRLENPLRPHHHPGDHDTKTNSGRPMPKTLSIRTKSGGRPTVFVFAIFGHVLWPWPSPGLPESLAESRNAFAQFAAHAGDSADINTNRTTAKMSNNSGQPMRTHTLVSPCANIGCQAASIADIFPLTRLSPHLIRNIWRANRQQYL